MNTISVLSVAGQPSPQTHPLDFSRVDMGELSPEVVGMENFDEAELDQYLPNGHPHAHLARANMPPPPPYATTGATPSSTSQTWLNAYRSMAAASAATASGMLQRIAVTGQGPECTTTDNASSCMSPSNTSTDNHNTDINYQGGMPNVSQQTGVVYDSNRNATETTSSQGNVKMEGNNTHNMQHYAQSRDATKGNSYELQMAHAYGYHGNNGNGVIDNMSGDYGNVTSASQQYYMQSNGQTMGTPPPYQCMAAGIRPLYIGGNPVAVNASTQWNKYGQL